MGECVIALVEEGTSREATTPNGSSGRVRRRLVLVSASALVGLVVYLFAGKGSTGAVFTQTEPDLARLLRAMALLKAGIVLVVLWFGWWRLARPLGIQILVSHAAAGAGLTAFAAWLWWLTSTPLVILLFSLAAIVSLDALVDRAFWSIRRCPSGTSGAPTRRPH